MARPKKTEEIEKKSIDIDDLLIKEYGNIIATADSLKGMNYKVIPVTPKLDLALGGGISEGTLTIFAASPKHGKMQDIYSTIYTPIGPKMLKDISIGDEICNPDGTISIVNQIFEHGVKNIYKITFSDGTTARCGREHLWEARETRYQNYKIIDLEYIMKSGLIESDGRLKWKIRLTQPVSFMEKKIDIHPYILGCLLGGGSFRATGIKLTSADTFIITKNNDLLDDGFYFKLNKKYDYLLITNRQLNKYRQILKNYKLWGLSSHDKFIPEDYLYNSIDNRWQLLQGLMDTNGSIAKDGQCEYSTVSKRLADNVKELIESLGGICIINKRTTKYNNKKFKSFRLSIKFTNKKGLFTLPRKVIRVKNRIKKELGRYIKSITYLGKEQCRCIKISNPNGLYLTDNYIITHNTSLALQVAKNALEIDTNNGPRECFYLNIESRIKERDIFGIKGLDPSRIKIIKSTSGNIISGENFLEIGEKILNSKPGAVVIFDSFSALCSKERFESSLTERFRDPMSLTLASFCRRISAVISINKSIVIGINHMYANASGKGNKTWLEGSGQKIQYAQDTKLLGSYTSPWLDNNENQIGLIVRWKVATTYLSGAKLGEIETYLKFGEGYSGLQEYIEIATDAGIISKNGAWYSFCDIQFQGIDKLRTMFENDIILYEKLKEQVKSLYKI